MRTCILAITFKFDVNEGDILRITGYKWLSNRYRLDILQFNVTAKDALCFKYFDVDRMFHSCTTPSIEWPPIKGMTYTIRDWVPDSTKFPPGLPEGRWKIAMRLFTYGKHVMSINWYYVVKYKLRMED
ncbi:uncharacterized protein LOC116169098 [Photinus pyralis]|uniref:uncharacterized protein LOC116169098 n=1 Tax=Photinus pyralis TaxID=7054 RepID=UPI0012672879|nr:uncharacterized protein LOC116169098 [Photinus pyralis]